MDPEILQLFAWIDPRLPAVFIMRMAESGERGLESLLDPTVRLLGDHYHRRTFPYESLMAIIDNCQAVIVNVKSGEAPLTDFGLQAIDSQIWWDP